MSLARYAKKRDSAEPAIISALEKAGAVVHQLDVPMDLLVGYQGRWYAIEVKTGRRKARPKQEEFIRDCWHRSLPAMIVRTPEEALQAVGAIH